MDLNDSICVFLYCLSALVSVGVFRMCVGFWDDIDQARFEYKLRRFKRSVKKED